MNVDNGPLRLASVDDGIKSVVAELSSQLADRSKRKE